MTTNRVKPDWKVYNALGEYVAGCKHVEDAAAIVAAYGDGATIRYRHRRVVWSEGRESDSAGNSYDFVGETCRARVSGEQ